jgi:hypothetical protein
MSYGVTFWETQDSKSILNTQKKIIRIMAGVKKSLSCKELFKKFNILRLVSEFLFSLVIHCRQHKKFQTISDIHNTNIKHKHDLHMPNANLTSHQKGAYYAGIKLFITLPFNIKSLNHDIKAFKPAFKDYFN